MIHESGDVKRERERKRELRGLGEKKQLVLERVR
jgi:hypothetical protein